METDVPERALAMLKPDCVWKNIIHASDGPETAKTDISFFFSMKELLENRVL
jgi:nucleoside diphosphate kinase